MSGADPVSAHLLRRPRILIADDHVVFAEGLAESLKRDFAIAGLVTRLDRLRATIERSAPDLVVLDLSFHGKSALPEIRELFANPIDAPALVVLTAHASQAMERAVREIGAMAFLSKDASTQELCLAITAALQGRSYVRPGELRARRRGATAIPAGHRSIGGAVLSRRQAEILLMIVEGHTRASIAADLGFTIKGTDYHLHRIKRAVGAPNLRLLHAWASEHLDALRAFQERGGR